jgi:hypothetical protein
MRLRSYDIHPDSGFPGYPQAHLFISTGQTEPDIRNRMFRIQFRFTVQPLHKLYLVRILARIAPQDGPDKPAPDDVPL